MHLLRIDWEYLIKWLTFNQVYHGELNRIEEVGSGTPCNYKQRDFAREYDQKTTVHVFSKQTIHIMLLRFLIVIMKHAT